MAQELRADLSKGHADLGASVSAQVQELDRAHDAMARQQRESLAEIHSDLALAERQRKSGVKTWLEEVAAAHGAAREEWQNLGRTMQARRAGVAVAEAAAPMRPEDEAAALRDRVFAYLADHPDGVRFVEIEQQFKLDSHQASSVLRRLVEDGKAKRAGRLYLAT
jgi:hypothetical protein